eukprot:tig00000057_g24.t1
MDLGAEALQSAPSAPRNASLDRKPAPATADGDLEDLGTRVRQCIWNTLERTAPPLEEDPPPGLKRAGRYLSSRSTYLTLVLLILLGSVMACLAFLVDLSIDQLRRLQALIVYPDYFFLSFFLWTLFSCTFAALAALCPILISPHGRGSGIPKMKSVLTGVPLEGFLSLRTAAAKLLGTVCSFAAGLFVGKEGPFVSSAACVAHWLCSLPAFRGRFLRNPMNYAQLLAAGCAVGITAAFGTPVGGVLFSIEVTSTHFFVRDLWWGFLASAVATVLFATFRTTGLVSLFEWTEFSAENLKPSAELLLFALCGVICGAAGALFVALSSALIQLRSRAPAPPAPEAPGPAPSSSPLVRYAREFWALLWRPPRTPAGRAVRDAVAAAFLTSLLGFPFGSFARNEYHSSMNQLFQGEKLPEWAHSPLEGVETSANPLFVLLVFVSIRFFLTALATALPIPCGVFVPVFTAGAALGRLFGEVAAVMFPDVVTAVPGVYAVAAGQLHYGLVVLTAVLVAYATADSLGRLSFYDELMRLQASLGSV